MKPLPTLCLALFLSSCAGGNSIDYLRIKGIERPTPQSFTHCYNYGCKTKVILALPQATQDKLKELFTPAPTTAEAEREKISTAIGIFETQIGEITGTKNDYHGTFRLYQDNTERTKSFQQDCVDESTNTTTYLNLLDQLGFLKFHQPAFPTSRQPFFSGNRWWHQTAVIEERASENQYVVDSWFLDNGYPAYVLPVEEWKDGWNPPKQAPNT